MSRTYLVVVDDSAETRIALRFAARRAAKTGGAVEVLAIVPPQDFVQWGGVQAAIEEEQRLRIEASVAANVGEIVDAAGIKPVIVVAGRRAGEHGARLHRHAQRHRRAGAGRRAGGQSGAGGDQFHRRRRGQVAVHRDDHPGVAERRAAGAA